MKLYELLSTCENRWSNGILFDPDLVVILSFQKGYASVQFDASLSSDDYFLYRNSKVRSWFFENHNLFVLLDYKE